MKIKWNLFFAAAFFGGWLLISNGVPVLPVLTGVIAAGAINLRKYRHSHVK